LDLERKVQLLLKTKVLSVIV